MSREEKKYEVLPGVSIPDMKTINAAASDFSVSGVEDVNVREQKIVELKDAVKAATGEDVEKLKALGQKVAEEEDRSAEESRKRMAEIKSRAISAPESMSSLKKTASAVVSEEKKEAIAREQEEIAQKKAEEEKKQAAREERRQMQQKALEESLARKAKEAEEKAAKEKAEQDKLEVIEKAKKEEERKKAKEEALARINSANNSDKKDNSKDDEYKAWVKAKKEAALQAQAEKEAEDKPAAVTTEKKVEEAGIASDDETMDDFSEFL